MGVLLKYYKNVNEYDMDNINKFLTELGNRFVSISTTPTYNDNIYNNIIIAYKKEEYVKPLTNVKLCSTLDKLNDFLDEIGNRFVSKDTVYSQSCGRGIHYVTYEKEIVDIDKNKETPEDSKKRIDSVIG